MPAKDRKPLPELSQKDIARFWASVRKDDGLDACWIWTGQINNKGYGFFTVKKTPYVASRIAYLIQNGDPGQLIIRHSCDTPLCQRGSHLLSGTFADNSQDAVDRGRMAAGDRHYTRVSPEIMQRGEGHYRTRLTEEDVIKIRQRYADGESCANIATSVGYKLTNICKIVKGKSWRLTGGPIQPGSLRRTYH